jgi:hypothetical protein
LQIRLAKAWGRYHGFMTDLATAGMEDWEYTQGFYYRLSQEAKENIDALAGGTSLMLNIKKCELFLRSFPLVKGRVRSMV